MLPACLCAENGKKLDCETTHEVILLKCCTSESQKPSSKPLDLAAILCSLGALK